jgi:hypothetical protein
MDNSQYKFPVPQNKEKYKIYINKCERYITSHLKRKMTKEEYDYIWDYKSEKLINKSLTILHRNCHSINMVIPHLTKRDGNCLFETLIYHGIGNSINDLRKGIATIIYLFQDYKNFLPNNDLSIKEIFKFGMADDDVQYVVSKKKDKVQFYKYTFNVMCQDLTNNYSWSNLPTNLILLIISFLYKVNIVTVLDAVDIKNSVSKLSFWEELDNVDHTKFRTIHIGHINKSHWVPIIPLKPNEQFYTLYHEEAKDDFIEWIQNIESEVINNKNNISITKDHYKPFTIINNDSDNEVKFA